MYTKMELLGEWYLPGKENEKVLGKLTYDENDYKGELHLFGSFDGSYKMSNYDIILGHTELGAQVSLGSCRSIWSRGGDSSVMVHAKYQVDYFFSQHITKDTLFNAVECEIDNLAEWLNISGFSNVREDNFISYKVEHKMPISIDFKIDNETNGRFSFKLTEERQGGLQLKSHLNQILTVSFSCKEGKTLDFFETLLFQFTTFFNLALYGSSNITNISLIEDSPSTIYHTKQKITTRIPYGFEVYKKKSVHGMLCSYDDLKNEDFNSIISQWFSNYKKLAPAINLFALQFKDLNSTKILENNFLNLAQVAETLHSRLEFPNTKEERIYEDFRLQTLDKIPLELHEFIHVINTSKSKKINLADRLRDLVSYTTNSVMEKTIGNPDTFVRHIVDTRNYYTHYTDAHEKRALKGKELFIIIQKLKLLLTIVFLKQSGLSEVTINAICQKKENRFFNFGNVI